MERLIAVSQELSLARSLEEIQRIVRTAARQLTGADGATFVLRDGDQCFYADEDAIEPLWKGKRFPLTACISGWAMLNKRSVILEDIYQDTRIPADAYRPTFVKSLVMVPIRTASPIGALGNYWARHRMPTQVEVKLLQALADSTSIALENVHLIGELEAQVRERTRALELAQRAEAEARREVTERLRAEQALSSTQAQLRQLQKMEAIGQLAAGIAHDFNNMLSVILSYGSLVAQALPEDNPLRADVDEIVGAGERASALTQQLLTFSRKQVLSPRTLQVNDVVGQLQRMLHRLLGEGVTLEVVQEPQLATAYADPGQIEQVLMNLAVNARDAMPSGGTLRIVTANVELPEAQVAPLGLAAGPYVSLQVQDTGTGMSDEVRERIFEPFFTTKDKGKGTGLGLSTVYGIVKQSGGHIVVDSQIGRGTTFTVFLPRHGGTFELAPSGVQSGLPRGNETVLLVEDDANVRHVASGILRRNGYAVLEANDVPAALDCYAARARDIALVITDWMMPGRSGLELARELQASGQPVKLLCISGHPGGAESGLPFLAKPLTPQTLLSKVRQLLDAA
ncbi:MAG: ATP-binding protein [Polyangiales bacterium]